MTNEIHEARKEIGNDTLHKLIKWNLEGKHLGCFAHYNKSEHLWKIIAN